ncbi:MAG: ribonuclease Y [Dehalococcoidia bacterium]|nr:ribonuclease Y [Dehalococcoidia bacterium]
MAEAIFLIITAIVALGAGCGIGLYARKLVTSSRIRSDEERVANLLRDAETRQKEVILEAKDEAIRTKAAAESEIQSRRSDVQRLERRVTQKEENLERKLDALERRDRNLAQKEKEQAQASAHVEELRKQQVRQLEQVAALSTEEARKLLLQSIEVEAREDASRRVREVEAEVKQDADRRAREIVATALQRLATDVVSETTVSVVPIPSDEMKGRIIGREGRNIRALENATGVDLIIDDTPDAVTLSAFDPVRREVARLALSRLILDGRIHPARIEELVNKARTEVESTIKEEGERAALEVGIHGLHPELIRLLGRLKYRFSYGQNVLIHSLEVAHLSGMIAAELGEDVNTLKRAGLLHDIGKAIDHDIEGTHASIGADMARRFGQSAKVIQAIAAHHMEDEPITLEAVLVASADSISGSRPGARRESIEHYFRRLEALEKAATGFPGVEKAYAIQAGREVRIIVKPEEVDDLTAMRLARDIVKRIEDNLEYPGQIKVTVIRETRAVEFAK